MNTSLSVEEITSLYKDIFRLKRGTVINDQDALYNHLMTYYTDEYETFITIFLDTSLRLIHTEVLRGSISSCSVPIRLLLIDVIKHKASGLILAHNHPSGSLEFSSNDIDVTRRIASVMQYVDVTLHDHVLFTATKTGFNSLRSSHPEIFS